MIEVGWPRQDLERRAKSDRTKEVDVAGKSLSFKIGRLVGLWPDSAVAGIRLERQLSEDELPTRQLSTTGGHPR